MKKTIRTIHELQKLRSFKARRGIRDIVIELPGSYVEIRKCEAQINKSLKACGCEIGAAFVAIGLLALTAFVLIEPHRVNLTSPPHLFGIVGVLGALALTGKLLGLAIATRRLRSAINKLERDSSQIAEQPATREETFGHLTT